MNQMRKHLPTENSVVIEEITDPVLAAEIVEQDRRHRLNWEWLEGHWHELAPQARGKFVAVAAQEAHIADTVEEAWDWVRTKHSEDNGGFVQYVLAKEGPRIYANRRGLGHIYRRENPPVDPDSPSCGEWRTNP